MTVGEVVAACEYIGYDVVDFYGKEIELNQDNREEVYQRKVEHLDAKDNSVRIWTFYNMDV